MTLANAASRQFWNLVFRSRQRRTAMPPMRVAPTDLDYRRDAAAEEAFWENPPLNSAILESGQTGEFARFINRSYTGDTDTSWMADLVRRGPFGAAAVLGSTQGLRESSWLASHASRELDVYDISSKVLSRARRQVQDVGSARTHFFRADLNFVELPRDHYDIVWSTACIHHVTNLEYLFAEVEASLRGGGLFALHDYVGEARFDYGAERLERANQVFARIPARFRYAERIERPRLEEMSPFEGICADETLDLARSRFDVLHLAEVDALYPLLMLLNFPLIEREELALLDFIFAAEEDARREPSFQKCSVYAVFRKRSPAPPRL